MTGVSLAPNGAISHAEFKAVADDVVEVKDAIKEMAGAITKIAVIDAKMMSQQQSIDRAFMEVASLAKAMEAHISALENTRKEREDREREYRKVREDRDKEHDKEHMELTKVVNRATGAVFVVYILVIGCGSYIVNTVSDIIKAQQQNTALISQIQNNQKEFEVSDRLKSEKDLRDMIRDMNNPLPKPQ